MSNVPEPLDLRVLRVIEELLKDRPPGARPVDAGSVLQRMREPAEAEAEVAEALGQLLANGDIEGKPLRGDNRVLDVAVMGITPNGLLRLLARLPIFTPEQRARITAAINERMPEGRGTCPYCGRDTLQLADGFIIFSSVRDLSSNYGEAILSGGPALPCFALVCNNCGNTVFLNVIALGLRDMLRERSL